MPPTSTGRRLRQSLSPEERVLLLTVRDDSDPAALAAEVARSDLRQLLYIAVSERATAVLWRRIAPMLADRDPVEVQALERTARVSEFRLMLLEDRLVGTVRALATLPTPPVLLKGAALATATYRSFQARPMGDLDVLVAAADASDAQRRLGGAGWQTEGGADSAPYEKHHHLPMISDAAGAKLSIELHTELFFDGNPFRFGAAEIRASAVPASVGGQAVLVPSPMHQLLHCVMHFAWSHEMGEGAWRTFRDVHAILDRGPFDWDAFVAAAQEARGATSAYWTLRLAASLTGLEPPAAALRALAPPGGEAWLGRLERHFALNVFAQRARCPSKWLAHELWTAGIRPGWSGHGASRPWMSDERFGARTAPAGLGADTLSARLRLEAERASRWAVYVRRVLGGAAGETS